MSSLPASETRAYLKSCLEWRKSCFCFIISRRFPNSNCPTWFCYLLLVDTFLFWIHHVDFCKLTTYCWIASSHIQKMRMSPISTGNWNSTLEHAHNTREPVSRRQTCVRACVRSLHCVVQCSRFCVDSSFVFRFQALWKHVYCVHMALPNCVCCAGSSPAGGSVVRDPPHLKSVPPISRLTPCLLHTFNTVFLKCAPLLVFRPSFWFLDPPAAIFWRRACLYDVIELSKNMVDDCGQTCGCGEL